MSRATAPVRLRRVVVPRPQSPGDRGPPLGRNPHLWLPCRVVPLHEAGATPSCTSANASTNRPKLSLWPPKVGSSETTNATRCGAVQYLADAGLRGWWCDDCRDVRLDDRQYASTRLRCSIIRHYTLRCCVLCLVILAADLLKHAPRGPLDFLTPEHDQQRPCLAVCPFC